MKKAVCFLLTFVFLLVSCAQAEVFSAGSAYEARMKALAIFDVCALTAEYPGENSEQGRLFRWESSIHIYIDGNPGYEDRATLTGFLMELALRVPDMPNITVTEDRSAANIIFYFGPLDQLPARIPDYVSGNWGFAHWRYDGRYRIYHADIGIATDVTDQSARNHLIQEELVAALGLTNDHMVYSDSIVYQPWTTVQHLSEVDWILLNMVYSPLVSPGMRQQELHTIFINAWTK